MKYFQLAITALALLASTSARGQQDATPRDASRHFQRGVDLYTDGDYRGALVEFKKAYTLLPRANVLYDIGETEYQLQDYAGALNTLERFLAETGPGAPHRGEVEETVEVLRTRVGRISLTTDSPGCDVSVDDQPVGTTPLGRALLVSVGSRRVSVTCAGRAAATKRVEVTGGETVRVELRMPPPLAAPRPGAVLPSSSETDHKTGHSSSTATAWTVTAILAATTVGLYTAALVEANQLNDLKQKFPADAGALDSKATWTTRLAISGDILAGATAAALCVSAYLSMTSPSPSASPSDDRKLHVGVTWNGIAVGGTF